MIQETIATGRDVNAAIDNGCQELGINREEDLFDFEIIAREKKSFFGLKTSPAKVRVFREVPDPKPVREEKPKAERQERPAPEKKAAPPKAERPAAAAAAPAPAPVAQPKEQREPKKESRPPREKKPREPRPPRQEKPKAERPAPPQEAKEPKEPREPKEVREPREPAAPRVEVEPTDNVRVRVERSAAYVEGILTTMGIKDVKVTPRYYEDNVCLQLTGLGLGVIIGRRGETLDSIQYLSSLVANRGEGDYIRINIDSGNYREKRERTLEALARKLANTAVRTGKSTSLEPMNPYERRIIHGAVSQVKGATSSSVGVDPNRRVVISAIDAPPPRRQGEGGGRGGRGRDRDRDRRRDGGRGPRREDRRGGPRPPRGEGAAPRPKLDDGPAPERTYTAPKAEPAASAPKLVEFTQEEREVTKKTSLYGKIEL